MPLLAMGINIWVELQRHHGRDLKITAFLKPEICMNSCIQKNSADQHKEVVKTVTFCPGNCVQCYDILSITSYRDFLLKNGYMNPNLIKLEIMNAKDKDILSITTEQVKGESTIMYRGRVLFMYIKFYT